MENKHKIPVGVTAKHDPEGNIKPLAIHWPGTAGTLRLTVCLTLVRRQRLKLAAGGYGTYAGC
ncbi:hypothetical protein [Sporomusa aerivorans]|uniref:hypothetical protein n=1 Tax=Sporomusa aerivorans TaxID=204936 RepID=UPI00352ACB8E